MQARAALQGLAMAAVLAGVACGGATPTPVPSPFTIPSSAPPPLPTVAAAGDIVCAPGSRDPCRHLETLRVVENLAPDLVLPLGDNQYDYSGTGECH